jgi:hypothetical protein
MQLAVHWDGKLVRASGGVAGGGGKCNDQEEGLEDAEGVSTAMSVRLPVYTYIGVDGFQMYPGTAQEPGIHHELKPGLHLVAGVNGLGKSTFLFLLYNGLVGPAAIRNDDFGVPLPEIAPKRDVERFRRRVADGARSARSEVHSPSVMTITRSRAPSMIFRWRAGS